MFKTCSSEGCPNIAKKGGVCVKHGAKTECKHEGCTNHAQHRGVCIRHGANRRNPHEESTAFTYGSEFEKTTATYPASQRASTGYTRDSSVPGVVVCGDVAQYEEV